MADFAQILEHRPALLEERNASASVHARCLCEDPPTSPCVWSSNRTANLCPLEDVDQASVSTEAAHPCTCSGLVNSHYDLTGDRGGSGGQYGVDVSPGRGLGGGELFGLIAAGCLLVFTVLTIERKWRKLRRRARARARTTLREATPFSYPMGGDAIASSTDGGSAGGGNPSDPVGAELPPLSLDEFRLELWREWEREDPAERGAFDPVAQARRGLLSARGSGGGTPSYGGAISERSPSDLRAPPSERYSGRRRLDCKLWARCVLLGCCARWQAAICAAAAD